MTNQHALNRVLPPLKSKLTRAKRSGDPLQVLAAVEEAAAAFNRYGWPDQWATWRIALDEARWAFHNSEAREDDLLDNGGLILARFAACDQRFMF